MFESISHLTTFINDTYEQVLNYWKIQPEKEEFDSIV